MKMYHINQNVFNLESNEDNELIPKICEYNFY